MTTWKKGTYDIQIGELSSDRREWVSGHPETVEGETWQHFGIHAEQGRWRNRVYAVTHLPTGLQLVTTWKKAQARRFCAEIADLADWQTIQPGECPPEIKDRLLTAWHRAHGAMFTDPRPMAAGAGGRR